jgi:hypothetical protein
MSKLSKNRRFSIECLEDRQMMAGDVEVIFAAGSANTLLVKEAAGQAGTAQAVMVSRAPTGGLRFSGLENLDGSVSKINGKSFVDFPAGISYGVDFRLGGGSDIVQIKGSPSTTFSALNIAVGSLSGTSPDNDQVTLENVTAFGGISISTFRGTDVVNVTNSTINRDFTGNANLTIKTGVDAAVGEGDRDVVFLEGLNVVGSTDITTGASRDDVVVRKSQLGSSNLEGVLINTGAGADFVDFTAASGDVSQVSVSGNLSIVAGLENEKDVDNVKLQEVFADNISMQLGGGGDVVDMVRVFANHNMGLAGNSGDDVMTLAEIEVSDNFFATMGAGNDTLDMTFVKAKSMTLDGGGDFDTLEKHQMPFIPTLVQKNWEVINGVRQRTIPPVNGGVLTAAR